MAKRLPRNFYRFPSSKLEALLPYLDEQDQDLAETELDQREWELETFGPSEKDQLDYPHNEMPLP